MGSAKSATSAHDTLIALMRPAFHELKFHFGRIHYRVLVIAEAPHA